MVQPTPPTDGGTPTPGPSYAPYDGTAASDQGTGWTALPPPSWNSSWQPPGEVLASPVPAGAAKKPRGPLVLALVAVAGVLAGAVGGALLVMAVFVSSAEEIGREIGAELGPEVGRAAGDGVADAMEDVMGGYLDPTLGMDEYGWGAEEDYAAVEQHPAVEPGELGPDPVLNQYAADCFSGDLQACDNLLYESAPLSAYEAYAFTCGGRVKQYEVPACTYLE
jgi:hypothetical protein